MPSLSRFVFANIVRRQIQKEDAKLTTADNNSITTETVIIDLDYHAALIDCSPLKSGLREHHESVLPHRNHV